MATHAPIAQKRDWVYIFYNLCVCVCVCVCLLDYRRGSLLLRSCDDDDDENEGGGGCGGRFCFCAIVRI